MIRRVKEEERIEMIIRGLLKLPENKRCINCNSLGPQYVCTNFWTFVCTKCSGVHREFTHRVKSVSMAKFSAEEVSSLQAGGNERAREIYLKTWDPRLNSLPDGSNLQRLRDFIKHVYVERIYAGEKSFEKIPMVKMNFKDEFREKRSYNTYCERHSFDQSVPVDDKYCDDGCRNFRHHDRQEASNTPHRGESLPPSPCKSSGFSLPEVRPVKDILGDNVPKLKVSEATKEIQETPNSTFSEKTSPSNSPTFAGGKQAEPIENSISLIDFGANEDAASSTDAENPLSLRQTQQNEPERASCTSRHVDSVESLLLELTGPSKVPSMADTSPDIPVNVSDGQQPPSASPAVDGISVTKQSSFPVEASSGRDILAALYSSQHAPVQGMGTGTQIGMGMPVPGRSDTSKTIDHGANTAQPHNLGFMSMGALQGALPFSSSYPQQSASHGMMVMTSGSYLGQSPPNNLQAFRPQENTNSDNAADAVFASLNPFQSKPRAQ